MYFWYWFLYNQRKEFVNHFEKTYFVFISNEIPYLPMYKIWITKCKLYKYHTAFNTLVLWLEAIPHLTILPTGLKCSIWFSSSNVILPWTGYDKTWGESSPGDSNLVTPLPLLHQVGWVEEVQCHYDSGYGD